MLKRVSGLLALCTALALMSGCAQSAGDERVALDLDLTMDTLDGPGGDNGVHGDANNVILSDYCASATAVNSNSTTLGSTFDVYTYEPHGEGWVDHAARALAPTGTTLASPSKPWLAFAGDSFMTWTQLDVIPTLAQRNSFAEYMFAMVNPLQLGTVHIYVWGPDINLSGDPMLFVDSSKDRIMAFHTGSTWQRNYEHVKEWAFQVDHCGPDNPDLNQEFCVKPYWFESLRETLGVGATEMGDAGLVRICPSDPFNCYTICRDSANEPLVRKAEDHCTWSTEDDPHYPHGLYCEGKLVTWTMIHKDNVPLNNGFPEP